MTEKTILYYLQNILNYPLLWQIVDIAGVRKEMLSMELSNVQG